MQKGLFPDCSYKAPCNGWVVCDNCFGKSIGRTRDIVQVRHELLSGFGGSYRVVSGIWGHVIFNGAGTSMVVSPC